MLLMRTSESSTLQSEVIYHRILYRILTQHFTTITFQLLLVMSAPKWVERILEMQRNHMLLQTFIILECNRPVLPLYTNPLQIGKLLQLQQWPNCPRVGGACHQPHILCKPDMAIVLEEIQLQPPCTGTGCWSSTTWWPWRSCSSTNRSLWRWWSPCWRWWSPCWRSKYKWPRCCSTRK